MRRFDSDKSIGLVFFILTVVFIIEVMSNSIFLEWTFKRHQNQWSWYIRPLFLIPFCFFAYQRSWSGISVTIFCLFTSMFWFNKPAEVSAEVAHFLSFEKEWLKSAWGYKKILLILLVPFSFLLLGFGFWKRSIWIGLSVIILMATGKIVWSIFNAGESGKSILVPATVGLVICVLLIIIGFYKMEQRER